MDNPTVVLILKQLQKIHILLVTQFDKLQQILEIQQGAAPPSGKPNFEDLIDEWEVLNILKISRTTLYRLKKSADLKGYRIGRKVYYDRPQIVANIKRFLK
ncbi:MAG: DNA-binding protein [Pedobacter sp.]|nr:MAG: DNA-binding protein [Pedobacter sp.]